MDVKFSILLTISVIFIMTTFFTPTQSHPHHQKLKISINPAHRVHRAKRSPISIEAVKPEGSLENNVLSTDDEALNSRDENLKTGSSWLNLEEIPPRRISVKLHGDVTIECIAVGSPAPQVVWLKNGIPLKRERGTAIRKKSKGEFVLSKLKSKLHLQCISPEDEAKYTCVAENEHGKVVASTQVIIEEDDLALEIRPECEYKLPTVFSGSGTMAYISSMESMHMQNLGSNIILPCQAEGQPKPKISWVDNHGQPIVSGEKFKINSNGNLRIRNLKWSDMGEFSCMVENSFGSDLAQTFVYPLMMD